MYAILRKNTYDSTKLAKERERLEQFQELHAVQPGFRGTIEIDAGDGRRFVLNLWDSEESASAALPGMVPVVKRLLEPMMSAPSELLGQGPVVLASLMEPLHTERGKK